jgi:hypothetical protein
MDLAKHAADLKPLSFLQVSLWRLYMHFYILPCVLDATPSQSPWFHLPNDIIRGAEMTDLFDFSRVTPCFVESSTLHSILSEYEDCSLHLFSSVCMDTRAQAVFVVLVCCWKYLYCLLSCVYIVCCLVFILSVVLCLYCLLSCVYIVCCLGLYCMLSYCSKRVICLLSYCCTTATGWKPICS